MYTDKIYTDELYDKCVHQTYTTTITEPTHKIGRKPITRKLTGEESHDRLQDCTEKAKHRRTTYENHPLREKISECLDSAFLKGTRLVKDMCDSQYSSHYMYNSSCGYPNAYACYSSIRLDQSKIENAFEKCMYDVLSHN